MKSRGRDRLWEVLQGGRKQGREKGKQFILSVESRRPAVSAQEAAIYTILF